MRVSPETALNTAEDQVLAGPVVIRRPQHTLSRSNVSGNALKVLYRLKRCGHQAFIVGGGVRDLLVGLSPKDFDVVTDARPEQVRALFRNCRLIGRRFRLAHVRFGREVIEVVTFRSSRSGAEDDREHTDSGRILRDNVYGTIDEDIWRRDFTVNALYYNIADFSIWDYARGMDDIASRTLRLIGDPVTRYREDPVRMLRAARLSAKLGFGIANGTARPIRELAELLHEVPEARLYDETLKLFHAGHAAASFERLRQFGLFRYLFPHTDRALRADENGVVLRFVQTGLDNTDQRVKAEKPVTPMFLYAVLLWFPILEVAERIRAEDGGSEIEAFLDACDEVVGEQREYTAFPRRFSSPMKEMLLMQRRFHNRRGARARRLLQHRQFRAAYDFLVLRAECGDADPELARWWTEVQTLSPGEQNKAFAVRRRRRSRRRRRGSRRSPAGGPGGGKAG